MPSRSKNARAATLFPLAFFSLLRRGRTRRRAGSAKGKGRALGNAPGKAKAEKPLEESRRAHLPVSRWETACALPGAAPVLAIRGIPPGGWGQRPQSSVLAARWPHRDETNRFRKKPLRRRREGPFSLSPAPRSGLFAARDPSRRGRVFAPGAGAFVPLLFPPRRGETPKAAGGHLHPLRGVPGQPRPGTGEGGAAKRPDCGPNGQQSAVASAPLTLR